MKKFILTSIAILGITTVSAQNATLKINLKPIQTLIVNQAQKDVALNYVTKDDYANGVTSTNADHLSIFSTGGFQVKVKSANSTMQTGNKNIQTNTVSIKASAGSDAVNGAQYAQGVTLSGNETMLVSSSIGGVDKKISVEYKGAGANAYLDNYIAGTDPTTYSTDLTYTIVSQ